jgi:hypothetical protein
VALWWCLWSRLPIKLMWGQRSVVVVAKQCWISFVPYKGRLRDLNKCAARQMEGLYNLCRCRQRRVVFGVIPLGGVVEECQHLRDALSGERSPLGYVVACRTIDILTVTVMQNASFYLSCFFLSGDSSSQALMIPFFSFSYSTVSK